jgi:hypothetical protein
MIWLSAIGISVLLARGLAGLPGFGNYPGLTAT